jgi:hypothetical protein
MAPSISLVTAIYGDYDYLNPLPDTHGFDRAICVTDDPELEADGWEIVHLYSEDAPIVAAKYPKMKPFDFVTTDVAVWLDANFIVHDRGWRDFCLESLGENDLVAWPHPEPRDCLYQEAQYCQDWPKYAKYPIRGQTAHYRREGMPFKFGLWACGGIVWRNNETARRFGHEWLAQQHCWSIQDQVSFPYVVWKVEPKLGTFPAHEFLNPYLSYVGHK